MAAIPPQKLSRLESAWRDSSIEPLDPARLMPQGALGPQLEQAFRDARLGALIGVHGLPDEDALFAALGIAYELQGRLPRNIDDPVQITFGDKPLPAHLDKWLDASAFIDGSSIGPERPVTIALDGALPERLPGLWQGIESSNPLLVLDHHALTPQTLGVNGRPNVVLWNDLRADAACLLGASLCSHMAAKDGRSLAAQSAEWFVRGIVWDTGNFQHAGTQGQTLQVAKFLTGLMSEEQRVQLFSDINAAMPPTDQSPAQRHQLELERIPCGDGRGVLLGMDWPRNRATARHHPQDSHTYTMESVHHFAQDEVDHLRDTQPELQIAVLVSQLEQHKFGISFRSQPGDDLALRLAQSFGGNGRPETAGVQPVDLPYETLKQQVLDRVNAALRNE